MCGAAPPRLGEVGRRDGNATTTPGTMQAFVLLCGCPAGHLPSPSWQWHCRGDCLHIRPPDDGAQHPVVLGARVQACATIGDLLLQGCRDWRRRQLRQRPARPGPALSAASHRKCKEKSEPPCWTVAPAAQLGLRGLNNASNTVEAWSPATGPSWAHHSRSFKATTGPAGVDKVPGAPGLGALNSPQALVTVHTADRACFGLQQYLPILPSTPGGPGPPHQPVACLAMRVQLQIDQ